MANRIEFINLSHPSQRSSSKLQRLACSHAARVTHARGKRARNSAGHAINVEPSLNCKVLPPMASEFEFINLSHPSQRSSSKLQRLACSHAARVTHARVKHARKSTGYGIDVEPSVPQPDKGGQISEATKGRDSRLVEVGPKAIPIVIPHPIDLLASSRRDPFGCFVKPLSPLESYLFDHYVTTIFTKYPSECLILLKDQDQSIDYHQLRISWIQLSMSNVGLLSAAFLTACRHLHGVYKKDEYATLAMQHRILCIRAIREAIGVWNCSTRDSITATIMCLAVDAIQAGNIGTFRQHVRGLAGLIHSTGGLNTLGMNGLLKHLFEKLAYGLRLLQDDEADSSE